MSYRRPCNSWADARSAASQGYVAVLAPGDYVVGAGEFASPASGGGVVAEQPGESIIKIVGTNDLKVPTDAFRIGRDVRDVVISGLVFDCANEPAKPTDRPYVVGIRTTGRAIRPRISGCRVARMSEFVLDDGGSLDMVVEDCVSLSDTGLKRHFVWSKGSTGLTIARCRVANSIAENILRLRNCGDALVIDCDLSNVMVPGDANKPGCIDFQGGKGSAAIRNSITRGWIRCGSLASSEDNTPSQGVVIARNNLYGQSWVQVIAASIDVMVTQNTFHDWQPAGAAPVCADTTGVYGRTSQRISVIGNRAIGGGFAQFVRGNGPRAEVYEHGNLAA